MTRTSTVDEDSGMWSGGGGLGITRLASMFLNYCNPVGAVLDLKSIKELILCATLDSGASPRGHRLSMGTTPLQT